jgi:hypothetical protein
MRAGSEEDWSGGLVLSLQEISQDLPRHGVACSSRPRCRSKELQLRVATEGGGEETGEGSAWHSPPTERGVPALVGRVRSPSGHYMESHDAPCGPGMC